MRLRRLLCLAVAALYACDEPSTPAPDASVTAAPTQERVPSNDVGAPALLDLTVSSVALGRDVKVRLILPLAFESEPERRWPVLYLLHGANEPLGYRAWSEQTRIETLAMAHDVMVVMPEGGQAGWYSDWVGRCSSSDTASVVDQQPRWETFHTRELPEVLRQHFRASERSAIAGLSMGGMGAASYAARHPGMFSAVASYSGALRTSKDPLILQLSLQLAGCDNASAVWGDQAVSPKTWAAHDPYALADKLVDVPLYLSVGSGAPGPLDTTTGNDPLEAIAQRVNEEFVSRLRELGGGARLTANLYGPGTHSWPYWSRELESSFAMLMEPLTRP